MHLVATNIEWTTFMVVIIEVTWTLRRYQLSGAVYDEHNLFERHPHLIYIHCLNERVMTFVVVGSVLLLSISNQPTKLHLDYNLHR